MDNNILYLNLQPQELTVTNEAALVLKTFRFTDALHLDALQDLIATLNLTFSQAEAAVFTPIDTRFYDEHPAFTPVNQPTAYFCQLFAEQLNYPVFTQDELAQAGSLEQAIQKNCEQLTWELDSYGFTPGKEEYSVESLFTVGNGFMGLRGTTPEMALNEATCPATYLAGLYNQATSEVSGQAVVNEDFVNAPNAQFLRCQIQGSEQWFDLENSTVLHFHRKLQLKDGLFQSEMILEDAQARQVKLTTYKIVNMAHKNNYSLKYVIEPLNFSAPMTIQSCLDASTVNFNVVRYRNLTNHHYQMTAATAEANQACLEVTTNQSAIKVRQEASIQGDFFNENQVQTQLADDGITQTVTFEAQAGTAYTLEKHVQVTQSLDLAGWTTPSPKATSFAEELAFSRSAWQTLWEKSDIQVTGDLLSQKLLRLHTYHLFVAASPFANKDLDVSVTARGLHGEAYRGHIFWDELFIFPFYMMHYPETAKQLLMYRYRRLPQARVNAHEAGYQGAMFPWQSGMDGTECTQKLHLNPLTGEWGEDHSILQRHVSLAIAYNVWLYHQTAQDWAFMQDYGLELLMEIAKFWQSATTYDASTQRYVIDHVMGPDEFHEGYPDKATSGLKNNAYTNVMVTWLFKELTTLIEQLSPAEQQALYQKTGTNQAMMQKWQDMARALTLEINEEGIIAQFAGYFDLKEVDWDAFKEKYGNIYRMDRILKAEGESADAYQVAKQADTLMLFYNLNRETVDSLLAGLGYQLPPDYLQKNLAYYLARTSHGSTLSRIVHADLASQAHQPALAWQLYQEALKSDYKDIQGGTTAEGIHTGVMAATIFVTLTTYGGVDLKQEQLHLQPNLPEQWQALRYQLDHRGITYQLTIRANEVTITSNQDTVIIIGAKAYELTANHPQTMTYKGVSN